MTVQGDIAAVLKANSALMAVLTGGVHQQDEVGEISRQDTPSAFNSSGELKPCALVTERNETPRGGIDHSGVVAVQTAVEVYFYERAGYANIHAAMGMAFPLLRGKKVGSSTWRVEFNNEIKNSEDQALRCPLGVQRWIVVRRRA